ncbi:peptidase domain-containing ABC transporter [Bacillus toyonensis]|uniref:peptidase domain-containing ABC transporter n=1 Tax=Bacillus toyonensis TaxID=155322 RepID=UPI00027955B1|nr:peptidase domain-containing ABC transporter [Bacillus toyonensis]EJQ73354.1 hypothetical protein IGK_05428 [Bacillus toyonensis]QWG98631.1 peptidase domain-containing ABC transporter [Bacillus toyonensis]HDR7226109.1 peptidase domain-containing ABC transporter [Bacillus toyonensis]HDR7839213.1 peptidase domain-containing ABC transporter [Bacillus toyonensis]
MRKKVPYVGQVQESECGLCCVSMLMGYYKQFIPVKTLSKTIEVGRDGVHIKKLGEVLDSFGYNVSYYEADSNSLIQIADKPLILFWNKNHYVVLEKIKNGMFYIVDPNFGRGKLTLEEFNEHFSNIVLLADPTEATKKINLKENPFKMYINYFKGKYWDLIALLICSILSTATVLLVSIFMKNLIDRTTASSNSILNSNMVIGLLGLMIMFLVFDLLKSNLVIIFSAKLDKSIYTSVVNKLFRVPYKFYLTRSSSDILFRLSLLKSNRNFFIETLIKSILDVGMLVFVLIFMLFIDPILCVSLIIISILLGLFLYFIRKLIILKNKEEIIEGTKLQGKEYETLLAISYLKSTGQEEYIKSLLLNQYDVALNKYKEKSFIDNIYGNITKFVSYFAPLLMFFLVLSLYQQSILSLGTVMLVYSISNYYFTSLNGVYSSFNVYGTLQNNLERIVDILEEQEDHYFIKEGTITVDEIKTISFDNVSFRYPGQTDYVINNLTFTVNKGEKVAIVGETGSGKSTITGLLLGLFIPEKGTIKINGINIEDVNRESLKSLLGYVPQSPNIFNKSIKENILMNRDINEKQLIVSAERASISNDIEKMPMKYETVISEMGSNLSGGQKQRIVLARAIIDNPDLLILDEATSAVDNVTEAFISQFLQQANMTQIIIAHRLGTIIEADKVIVLQEGEITNIGTHSELLNRSDLYKQMYDRELNS